MCGLTGLYSPDGTVQVSPARLQEMNDLLFHRGPDGGGTWFGPGVGLGHRRLAIIDRAGGEQPLFNEDGQVVVVYNGEIYNFPELTVELEAAGHTFHTHCDTEVIVHGWEEWGPDCVKRFRGMFAFALWDNHKQELFLARDRLGIKPLFWSELPSGELAFASELKALQVLPDLPRELSREAVEDYFAFGYVPDPRTIYSGVHKLEPGHTLHVRRGQPLPKPERYWNLDFTQQHTATDEELLQQMVEQLDEAVKVRMVAEVPLGAFLSGGVDSSAVVASMAQASADPVNTCAMAFDDPAFDEAAYAEQVAAHCKSNHITKTVAVDDYGLLDTLAATYDEPYADSSAIPTYRVCELAKERVTVALSGDGGDEALAGYRRYRWFDFEDQFRRRLPASLRRTVFGALGRWYPKADWAPRFLRAKATFQAIARDSVEGYFHGVSLCGDELREQLFSSSFKQALGGYSAIEVFRRHAKDAPVADGLSLVQYLDFKTYLPGDILTKVDRASMAHSLEVRVPLLDHHLLEWAAKVPPAMRLKGGQGKYVFKKAMEERLPHDILYRPKMGFAVPLARWFRGPLKERISSTLLGERLAGCGFFNMDFLAQVLADHSSGMRDYSALIWSLLMFDGFLAKEAGIAQEAPAEQRVAG